jgi:uncharacterized membrane protein
MDAQTMSQNPDHRQLVVAIFHEQPRAEAAVRALRDGGFGDDRLSVLFRPDNVTVSEEELVAIERDAEATGTDVAVGSTVGGLAGLLGGLALFSIPGLGPLLGVGVLATTIGGAALGSALGERAAHLQQLGVPHERTQRYGSALESGQIILAVFANDADDVMRAREILALQQADEIDVHGQTA